jgi:hypothetical protein
MANSVQRTCQSCGEIFYVPEVRLKHAPHIYCSKACCRASKAVSSETFFRNVNKTPSGCWLWAGCKTPDYYGRIRLNGRIGKAHRQAYVFTHGPIPNGLYVLHRCDMRACVNPEHLFLGTHRDNMLDMVNKGRSWLQRCPEESPTAKLSRERAREIASRYVRGIAGNPGNRFELAAEYGISTDQLGRLVNGHTKWLVAP